LSYIAARRFPTGKLSAAAQDFICLPAVPTQAQFRGNQMRCVSVCVVAAAAALLLPGVARAQLARPAVFAAASAAHAKKMSAEQREERRFLQEAAAASHFESEASRMALAKSNNPAVRSFAATLINHHASTGVALQQMLRSRGMAPPMLANDQRKTLNRLAKLNGAKFDREYTEEVGLRYQQDDLQGYERESLAAQDPMLKGWLARTLPTLRYHLTTAQRIALPQETGRPVKVRAQRGPLPAPGRMREAAVASKAAAPATFKSHQDLATQFMGAGPMQLGVTRPVAEWPIESNTR
jgi:predicted outer membrane protein